MTLAEYIEDKISLKYGAGAEEVCWEGWEFGRWGTYCEKVLDPYMVEIYETILRQELDAAGRLYDPDLGYREFIEATTGPLRQDVLAMFLYEIGRIIIARTPVTIYSGEEYQDGASQILTAWKAEDFGYEEGKPYWLWMLLKEELYQTEYTAFVNIDLLVGGVWSKAGFPTTLSYTAPREERTWIYEKLDDVFEYLTSIYSSIFTALFGTWWQFTLTVAAFYFIIGPALAEAMIPSIATYVSSTGTIVTVTGTTYWSTTAFVTALKGYFGAFLAAIHYSTLVSIHEIAYLVSATYREMMAGVYAQISELSEALGYGPWFLALFIRNTRTLVLDASTMMGMKYDMAQIQWLAAFQEYSEILSARAYLYVDDPEALFYDMETLIEAQVVTSAGIFMETLTTTVSNTLTGLESAVSDIVTLRDDLDQLVSDLPESIQASITPITDPIIARFDEFLSDKYEPTIGTIQALVDTVSLALDATKGDLDGVVERLKSPAGYLLEIDGLTDEERIAEEDQLSEVTGRGDTRAVEEYQGEGTEDIDQWAVLSSEIETERTEVEWMTPEEGAPSGIPMEEMEPGETWFVGDY